VSEVLSQSEIDALLNAMSSGDLDAAQVQEEAAEAVVRPFDFLRPSKFSKDQLRTIELLHETFCRSAQNHLSGALRAMVEIEVLTADQVSYGEYVNSIPTPSLINIVTMEPLEGNAVLEINLPIVFSIIDRLVGGAGTHRPRTRELTEIELALVSNVVETLMVAFTEAWGEVTPVRFKRVGTEMNPQFAQVTAPSDMVVLISFELRVGPQTGMFSLCIPALVLEPAMGRLTTQSYYSSLADTSSPESRQGMADELGAVSIPVAVELGGARLNVGDLLSLAPGDVIPLAVPPGTDARVRIGRRHAFSAQPGVRGRRAAVQITGTMDDSERTYA
jgi:flagellar motor switch protein FliM